MTGKSPVAEYVLNGSEADELRESLARLCPDPDTPVDPAFYDKHWRCHQTHFR